MCSSDLGNTDDRAAWFSVSAGSASASYNMGVGSGNETHFYSTHESASISFTAVSAATRITFATDNGYAILDNITLSATAIPEPSSAALLVLGSLTLTTRRKR